MFYEIAHFFQNRMLASNIKVMGECGYSFLKDNYLVNFTYNQVIKHLR